MTHKIVFKNKMRPMLTFKVKDKFFDVSNEEIVEAQWDAEKEIKCHICGTKSISVGQIINDYAATNVGHSTFTASGDLDNGKCVCVACVAHADYNDYHIWKVNKYLPFLYMLCNQCQESTMGNPISPAEQALIRIAWKYEIIRGFNAKDTKSAKDANASDKICPRCKYAKDTEYAKDAKDANTNANIDAKESND